MGGKGGREGGVCVRGDEGGREGGGEGGMRRDLACGGKAEAPREGDRMV